MIRIMVPGVPPSINHLYTKTRGGGRALSEEGRAYKTDTTVLLAQQFQQEMRKSQKNIPYFLVARFFFEDLENAGWGKGKASRYKHFDVTNRIKIFEDCLKDAGGYDDNQNMTVILQKKQGLPERIEVWAWNLDIERTPFDDALQQLQ